MNDYGFELLSVTEVDWAALLPGVLGTEGEETLRYALRTLS